MFRSLSIRLTNIVNLRNPSLKPNIINSIRTLINDSSAYDGDGKTTVRVLGYEQPNINYIQTYSGKGFRLSNNLFIYGSILVFPTHVYSWGVKRGNQITPESLILFDLIVPKTKIVVIGYGQQGEEYDPSIVGYLRKKGISCELLPTPHAVTTYNYLTDDSVHVAGAFIPMYNEVKVDSIDRRNLMEQAIVTEARDYISDRKNVNELMHARERFEDLDRETGKTKFDE